MLNKKYYLHQIEKLKQHLSEIGVMLEDERRNSNEEDQAVMHELLIKQSLTQKKIAQITQMLQSKDQNGSVQHIGTKFTVSYNSVTKEIILVLPHEANPIHGMISTNSPLGRALIGRKQGESFSINTPAGDVNYKVISVTDML